MERNKNILPFAELGRVPPQAIDLEEAVLGIIMLTNNFSAVSEILSPECFYKDPNQRIFSAMKDLNTKNETIDMLTLSNELKNKGELEIVGGAYKLSLLTNNVGAEDIVKYARIVKEKYVQREIIRVSGKMTQLAFEDTTDTFDLVEKMQLESASIAEMLFSSKMKIEHISFIANDCLMDLNKRIINTREGKMTGLPTPFKALDKATGGWRKSDLIILAGRPSMGKSALALAISDVAGINNNLSFFSLEMSRLRLVDRLLIAESGVSAGKYRNGWLSNEEILLVNEAKDRLASKKIWIDDSGYVGLEHIKVVSRIQKAKGELDMIVVDYLQLASTGDKYKGNRESEVSELSRGLKGLAKEINVPILVLAQLNRGVETRTGSKKPILADLRESGAIEQDSDLVMFIYRPSYYKIEADNDGNHIPSNMGLIIIAKNREGPLIEIPFSHNESLTKFWDYNEYDSMEQESQTTEEPF